jgi:hypothetical protein
MAQRRHHHSSVTRDGPHLLYPPHQHRHCRRQQTQKAVRRCASPSACIAAHLHRSTRQALERLRGPAAAAAAGLGVRSGTRRRRGTRWRSAATRCSAVRAWRRRSSWSALTGALGRRAWRRRRRGRRTSWPSRSKSTVCDMGVTRCTCSSWRRTWLCCGSRCSITPHPHANLALASRTAHYSLPLCSVSRPGPSRVELPSS